MGVRISHSKGRKLGSGRIPLAVLDLKLEVASSHRVCLGAFQVFGVFFISACILSNVEAYCVILRLGCTKIVRHRTILVETCGRDVPRRRALFE